MVAIRAYTTIEQSRKLAEILPLESADMRYYEYPSHIDGTPKVGYIEGITGGIPCWSLAALLGVLPKTINNETLFIETSPIFWHIGYRHIYTARADNPVDVCYEMLLKLNEIKLL